MGGRVQVRKDGDLNQTSAQGEVGAGLTLKWAMAGLAGGSWAGAGHLCKNEVRTDVHTIWQLDLDWASSVNVT